MGKHWSTEIPTEAGWYWIQYFYKQPELAQILIRNGKAKMWTTGNAREATLSGVLAFCGPVEEPLPAARTRRDVLGNQLVYAK